MSNLQHLSDRELLKRIRKAEHMEDLWRGRQSGHWIHQTSRDQEARHTFLFWNETKTRLYAEEDRRGGYDALYARLGNTDQGGSAEQ